MRISLAQILEVDGIFGAKFDILTPRWLPTQILREKFNGHLFSKTGLEKLLSEASLGKGYLREMGIRPLREVQPDVPASILGTIMSSYYGGRAEVHLSNRVQQ